MYIIVCVSHRTAHHIVVIVCDGAICGVLIDIRYCTTLHIVIVVIVGHSTAVHIVICVNISAVDGASAGGRACACTVIVCSNGTCAI